VHVSEEKIGLRW